ncbi:MAG: hypothetical protein EOO77_24325, partial [Oxalobacteraceae bacterium]
MASLLISPTDRIVTHQLVRAGSVQRFSLRRQPARVSKALVSATVDRDLDHVKIANRGQFCRMALSTAGTGAGGVISDYGSSGYATC